MPCNKICDDIAAANAADPKPWFSIEFFPPKTEKGVENMFKALDTMKKYKPLFADFTWGAGGSTSDLTVTLCQRTWDEFHVNPNMHLTCTNMEVDKIDTALASCISSGLTNILALRGDPPAGQTVWHATHGGLTCALDLVNYITEKHGDTFSISVAGYPEGHPNAMTTITVIHTVTTTEGGSGPVCADVTGLGSVDDVLAGFTESERLRCSTFEEVTSEEKEGVTVTTTTTSINVCRDNDFETEMSYLKSKIDAGANCIITQMFFDCKVFNVFVEACRKCGIMCPIVPGIMLISTFGGFNRMIGFCKTRVPAALKERINAIKDDAAAVKAFGIEFGTTMCQELTASGTPGLHFYTLNTSPTTVAILEALGYKKEEETA